MEAPQVLFHSKALRKVRTFADNMIQYGRDDYGPRKTPLFAEQLDVRSRRIPTADKELHVSRKISQGDHRDGCNFHWDAPLIRVLDALTSICGDTRYRQAADEYMGFALENCQMEYDGRKYMAAGDHSCYLLSSDTVLRSSHELRSVRLPWSRMYEINPTMTVNEIERLYDHIIDPAVSFAFNRHVPHEVPLSLPSSGGAYIAAWAFLFRQTGDPKYYEWAKGMADFFWTARSPQTGIPPTWGEGRGRRTGGNEPFRSFCANLLYAFDELGPEKGGLFRDQSIAYLYAYKNHFRTPAGFCVEFDVDTGQGFGEAPYTDHTWRHERLLQTTATVAYCAYMTKDPGVVELAEILTDDLSTCTPDEFIDAHSGVIPCLAWKVALLILVWTYMYRLTKATRYLTLAQLWVDLALSHFYNDGFFVGTMNGSIYHNRAGSSYLALAVFQHELLINGSTYTFQDDVVLQN